jgi:hypothetical protein
MKAVIQIIDNEVVVQAEDFVSEEAAQAWLSHCQEAGILQGSASVVDSEDLQLEAHNKQKAMKQKLALGKVPRAAADEVWDLISGWNMSRDLTIEQIDEMETIFAGAAKALQAKRPDKAKSIIEGIQPDGVLVTAQMIEDALLILSKHGL